MFPEFLHDYCDTYQTVPAWRCPNCGDIVDATILQQRTLAVQPKRKGRPIHHPPLRS